MLRAISRLKFVRFLMVMAAYVITSIILTFPLIIKPGIPFAGDETYYASPHSPLALYSWTTGKGPYIPIETIHNFILFLLIRSLGLEAAVKLWLILVSALPGIVTFFTIKEFLKYFRIDTRHDYFASFFGGLFYMVAFTNPGPSSCAPSGSWPYIVLPLLTLFVIKYMEKGSLVYLTVLSVLILLGNPQPITLLFTLILSIICLLLLSMFVRELSLHILIKRTFCILAIILVVNAYWIFPNLVGYIKEYVFAQVYTTERMISFGSLQFLSHWKLLDVLLLGEGPYFFFWMHPRNYTLLNSLIPIFSSIAILAYRRNKGVLFLALLLILGIFLTKGVWPPAGELYYYLASSIPYFGAYLRDPTKFVPLVVLSYAVLTSLGICYTMDRLKIPLGKKKSLLISCVTVCLILSTLAYGMILDLKVQSWNSYSPTYVPRIYEDINNQLIRDQAKNFKVMWIPSGGAYLWKPYIITAFPDLLSLRPAVDFRKIYPEPLKSTDNIGKLLKVLGVKYVIFHGDSLDYPNEEILQDLLRQKDLKIAYESNYTYVPEDNSEAPLPLGQSNIQFSQSPFKLVEPSFLPRGEETEIIIQYVIPEDIAEMGFKGKFWAGFSIGLNGFSAGSVALDRRVFGACVYEQRMLNETSGYAVFKVKVPYTYPGTAIDIYANFYDGGFKGLTPSYFIVRLPVSPREITVPFIVFENEEYNRSIYQSSLTLTYGLSLAEILNIEDFDTDALSAVSVDSFSLSHDLLDSVQVFIYSNSTFPNWLDNWLANSNTRLVYMMPLDNLNLTVEKPIAGPYEPSYYVYSEKPLTPLSSLVLERGRGTLVNFSYYLPKPVLDEGFKGKFWAGFGIGLWGYPHGVAPAPDVESKYRVFEAFISNFTLIDDFKGYVSFNITVPRDFGGTEIDAYANFYDGSFRPISPAYFVGTFKVKGTTLVKTDDGHPELHMVYDSLPIDLYIPRNGNYALAVKARGTLSVNSTSLKCNGNWAYVDLSHTERGHHVIVLSTDSEIYIRNLVVFSLDREVDGLSQVFKAERARLLNYRQISPVEWEATVNASSPFILVFTEPYDRLWRAYVNGKEIEPIMLYDMVNGFPVNETGIVHIRIYYTLQTYYNLGLLISGVSFIILAFLCTRRWLLRKLKSLYK